MSEGVPRLTPDHVIRIIRRLGFELVRQSGSHKIFRNAQGIRITIPHHKGTILHPKIIKSIIRDLGLSNKEFHQLV